MSLREALVDAIVAELARRHRVSEGGAGATGRVDLDDIDAAIGERAVSYDEVEAIVDRLERLGLEVGTPPNERDVALLRRVLGAASAHRAGGGRPSVATLAGATGLSEAAVRRALLLGRRFVKPRPTGEGDGGRSGGA